MIGHEKFIEAEKRSVLRQVRTDLRRAIRDMEGALGVDAAYPVTKHMLAAMEETKRMEVQR